MPLKLKDVPFFHDLTPDALQVVQKCLVEKTYEKGDIIHSEGKDCSRLFFIQSGRVKVYRTSSAGREQIFEILGEGDTCACNPGNITWFCNSTAEAVAPTKVWFLDRENYVRMVGENTTLMHSLNELFAKRLLCFSNIIEEVSLKDSKKRLIKFILEMLQQKKGASSKNDVLFINFTREELAQRLGAARETIARNISELKRKKLIDVKPYQIIIRDKKGLEALL